MSDPRKAYTERRERKSVFCFERLPDLKSPIRRNLGIGLASGPGFRFRERDKSDSERLLSEKVSFPSEFGTSFHRNCGVPIA